MPSRRHFLSVGGAAFAGAILWPRNVLSRSRSLGSFTPIRRGIGTFEARGGTIGYLATADGVAMVDSQYPDTAAECLAGLSDQTGRSIDLFINSHHHGDHTAGNTALVGTGAVMVAHRNVPGLQRASAEARDMLDQQVYADTLYDETWEIDVGDEMVRLHHYGPGHTGGDSVIHFERADVVHMGDLMFNRMPPFIDRAAGASVAGWIDVLENVHAQHTDETVFIFGHGNPAFGVTGTRADLLTMRDFMSGLLSHARAGLAAGQSVDEIAVPRIPGFEEHYLESWADGIPNAVRAAIDELQDH